MSLDETNLRNYLESLGYNCRRYDYPPGTYFAEHSHQQDKIDAIVSGCLRVTTATSQVDLVAGDYAFIPAGLLHSAEVIGEQEVASIDAVRKAETI